jgi:serine O-acetyltransferase
VPANLRRDAARLQNVGRLPYPWNVLEALLFDNGFQAVVIYRFARWFKVRRIPFLGPAIARLGTFLTGAEISPSAQIGPGLRISHGVGIVVGGHARIGAGAVLLHQVTLGSPSEGRVDEMPVLGDGVFVAAGAKLIGRIEIGDGVIIGPNCVVTRNIPAGSKVLPGGGISVLPPRPRVEDPAS